MKDNIITQKSFAFSVRIVKLCQFLRENKSDYVLSKQILRCGTSIGANLTEAYNGESAADFIHKFSISQKECGETLYWLKLLHATEYIEPKMFESFYADCNELYKMITSTIKTKKQNK
jgi:four helix bundle protein